MHIDRCTLCGQCVAVCPTGAAELATKASTIDRDECIGCGKCTVACLNEARKLAGKYMTVEEITAEVLRDKAFYASSGGGVTLSGGEPTAQADFALAILRSCKNEGLHTVLDTCGYASWPVVEKLLEYVDLVYYDIKCIDVEKHVAATGVRNDIILDNAKRLAKCKPIRIRVPLIPGFNDSEDEVKAITHFVRTELGSVDIDLLKYNKFGEGKYRQLDREGFQSVEQSEEYIEHLKLLTESAP